MINPIQNLTDASDYKTRSGYSPDFLGSGSKRIPLPQLSPALKASAAINRVATGRDRYVLPYQHFSVVMNHLRRLAFYTAVNIDGKTRVEMTRETDKWVSDPRIGADEQTNARLYTDNDLDLGHLVRRLDPVWGASSEIARVANDDTFHFTNCCPQHMQFNRDKTTWAGLEDYILKNSFAFNLRVTVFTGPVFSPDDPQYRGIQVPTQFWKVVSMVKQNGKLTATAYLLSQAGLIHDLTREFVFGAYKTYQVPIAMIERLTSLKFGRLKTYDPLAPREGADRDFLPMREIEAYTDIIL